MTLGCTSVLTEAGAPVSRLCFLHLFWIVLSNFAVQLPLTLWGIETTWGMFTYPFIYVTSDLTVRLYGSPKARAIVRRATIPGFFLSYLVGVLFEQGAFQGFASLLTPNLFVFRIALASLVAYFVSQNLDIRVFRRYLSRVWWIAPAASGFFGNVVDTFLFYSVAFYRTSDVWMATHWPEIAVADLTLKIAVNLLVFVPVYGAILSFIVRRFAGKSLQRNLKV